MHKDLFKAMCKRRNKNFVRYESVPLSTALLTTLADLTALLAADANAFYYIDALQVTTLVAQVTQPIRLRITNYGGGSAGNVELLSILAVNSTIQYQKIECDSMLYFKNGSTAGTVVITGTVYKIVHSASGA